MIDKLFHILYDTIIITIIKSTQELTLYIEVLHKKTLKDSIEKTFILNDTFSDTLLYDYLKQFIEETPYYYVTLLDVSYEQGAIPTCNKVEFGKYKDLSTAKHQCYENKWLYYTSFPELEEQLHFIGKVGVDFVFSPFIVLSRFFHDKMATSKETMFVLVLKESLTLAVFKENQLLFGSYIDISAHIASSNLSELLDEEEQEIEEQMEESVNLDDIALDGDLDLDDDLDELDDFDTIEDLNTLDALDTGDDLEQRLEENLEELDNAEENQAKEEEESNEGISDDYQHFLLIQQTLKAYYDDEKYNSDFIENIYIADGIKLSNDFKHYLQDELFLNVYIRSVEVEMELAALTKKELGLV